MGWSSESEKCHNGLLLGWVKCSYYGALYIMTVSGLEIESQGLFNYGKLALLN